MPESRMIIRRKKKGEAMVTQCPGERGDFLNRFAFARQFTEKPRLFGRRNRFVNEPLDRDANLLLAKRFECRELLAEFFEHTASLRKGGACSNIKNRQQEEF